MNGKTSIKKNPVFRIVMLIIAALVILVFKNTTPPEGLEANGWMMLGILITILILFISEALPQVCNFMLVIILLAQCGIDSLNNLMKSACSSTLFFVMAGFALGGALKNTNIATIIFRALWGLCKGRSDKLIAAIIWLSAIISFFIADSAAQVVAVNIVIAVIAALGDREPGSSRLDAGLMMAVYVGAMTGGLAMPCSNPVNITIMDLANTQLGIEVSFFQWCLFGIPVALVFTWLASLWLPRYFKPESMTEIQVKSIEQKFESIPSKLNLKDWYFIVVLAVMLILWLASNWVKAINVTIVAMVGMLFLMLPFPQIQILSAKGYKENFNVMVPVTMLCLFPLAACMKTCGLGEWLVNLIFGSAASTSFFMVFVLAGICGFIIHMLIPSGSAAGALAATLMLPIMQGAGVPIAAAMFCIGVQTSIMFILPLEGAWQHTFSRGYYTFDDVIKGTTPLAVISLVMSCIVTPLLAMIFAGLL